MRSQTSGSSGRRPVAVDEFETFCTGVRRLCDIDLLQYKRGQMERRVRTFAERRGTAALGDYLAVLSRDAEELDAFLDRVTINVSQLWRHPEQWDYLARAVLPDVLAAGSLRAWSAGSSYGAEAYTLAAVCGELGALKPGSRVRIKGTDIDRRMVERARLGTFSAEDARTAPRKPLERWFQPEGAGWRAGPALRAVTAFETGDLLRLRPPAAAYDLVMCRNTVIYFTEDVRNALHGRLATALRHGGHLFVGATERITDPSSLGLKPVHPFVYRRT